MKWVKVVTPEEIPIYTERVEDWPCLPKNPVVSVRMITYNHENFIREAVDSVLMQSANFDVEILIRDDKSTDKTRDIVQEYQNKYPDKIRLWLNRENLYSQGINIGGVYFSACRGKYIALLEGDDYWTDPLKLQKQVEFLEAHPEYSMCAHNTLRVWEDGSNRQECLCILRPKETLMVDDFLDMDIFQVNNNLCLPAHTSSYLIRATSIPRSPPEWFLRCTSGDFVLTTWVARSGPCHFIDEVMSVRRKHAGSITSKTAHSVAFQTWINAYCGFDALLEYKYHTLISKKILQLLPCIISEQLQSGSRMQAWRVANNTALCADIKRQGRILYFRLLSKQILGNLTRSCRRCVLRMHNQFMGHFRKVLYKRNARTDLAPPETLLSVQSKHCFFGYYDLSPFSLSENKVLACVTGTSPRKPGPSDRLAVGFFDLQKGASTFNQVDYTDLWCWQQGCRLRWHPSAPETLIIYNRLVDGRYGSVIQDVNDHAIHRAYPFSLYDISSCGKVGVTLNFSRLQRLRPGYGYGFLPDDSREVYCPADDGVWLADLSTESKELLFSCARLAQFEPSATMEQAEHYINHLKISPSATSCMFLHLWVHRPTSKRYSRLFVFDLDGSRLQLLLNGGHVSHYTWLSDDVISIVTRIDQTSVRHALCHKRTGFIGITGVDTIKHDGHQSFLAGGDIMITDTYPNQYRDQCLLRYHVSKDKMHTIARYNIPSAYRGEVRCDLHPRVSATSQKICIDMVHDNMRAMTILDAGRVLTC